MPLYVKDPEVDRLAVRLAALRHTSKTDVVREALLHELERVEGIPSLIERGVAFARTLRESAEPGKAQSADKDFIDGLYGQP